MNSLRFRFNFAFILIIFFNLAGAGVVFYTLLDQKNDAQIINLAGAQRMLSQKLTKEALLLSMNQSSAKDVEATMARFNAVLTGLLAGNAELGLPKTTAPDIIKQLDQTKAVWEDMKQAGQVLLEAHKAGDKAKMQGALQTLISDNVPLLTEMNKAVGLFEQHSNAKVSRLKYIQTGVVAAVVLCILWLWLGSVRRLILRLESLIQNAAENSETLSRISAQISSASNDLSEGSTSQASSLEETSAALEEMASMTRQNADNTMKANELSTKMQTEAEVGDDSMKKMGHAVNEITDSSSEIGKIIKVIEEIAFQTNLLALNAAVEAARAGDAGKGFAVVADEVRNLAQRSSTAAQETNALIERAVQRAKNGSNIAETTGKQLALICGMIKEVNSIVEGITTANNEQAQGVDQVNTAVSNMDRITQSNAALAEETSSAAEELAGQAERLNDMVTSLRDLVHGGGNGAAMHATAGRSSGGGFFGRRAPSNSPRLMAPAGYSGAQSGEFVPWTPQMSTGIDSMDEQHKVLFRLINELHRSLKNGSDKSIMVRILQELTNYTDTHFAKEEVMLREIGYPKLNQQEKLHREFVAKLNELIENQKSGKMMLGLEALQFLKKWLTVHIQKVDHEYGPYAQDHGIQ